MPALTPTTVNYFVGRTIRHRRTWNPAKLLRVLSAGDRIEVVPQCHGGKLETCDTADYDAFISRNPDLRYLFDINEAEDPIPAPDPEPDMKPASPAPQPPIETYTAPDPPLPKEPEDDLLTSLMRIKTVRAEIADLESTLALKRLDLQALQQDARALRSMLDEVIGDPVPAKPAARPITLPNTSAIVAERTRIIVDWARTMNGPFTCDEAVKALSSNTSFSGLEASTRPNAFRAILERQPAFKKVGRGTYRLA